jgi:hypothetical protein
MDGFRFDSLARSLATASSRRRALGGLLAGALGLVGWPGGEDAAAHDLKAKCKKKSGEAKKKCLKKAKKHAATHADETPPPPPPPACDPACGVCQVCAGGECLRANDNAVCNGSGRCLNGVCNPQPACLGLSDKTCTASEQCCTGVCDVGDSCNTPALPDDRQCRENGDCISGHCVGYRCRGAAGCFAGKGYCLIGSKNAADCPCLRTTEAGIRAGSQLYQTCGACQSTQDCIDTHGPDAFCAQDNGTFCDCPNDKPTFCALQCCPGGQVECGGVCRPRCDVEYSHDPATCACCGEAGNASCDPINGGSFDPSCCANCCSGACDELGVCAGFAQGQACRFGAQCDSSRCTNGTCA